MATFSFRPPTSRKNRVHLGRQVDVQVDGLAVGEARRVERIVAARVPDRDDGMGVLREIEGAAAGIRVEPVGRVPGARRHVRAVHGLDRGDVMKERSRGAEWFVAVRGIRSVIRCRAVQTRPEIGHHRKLIGVLRVFRKELISLTVWNSIIKVIVAACMREPERMPDLMQIRTESGSVFERPRLQGSVGGAQPDFCGPDVTVIDVGVVISSSRIVRIGE